MNVIQTYKIANRKKHQVEFGAQRGGKWQFRIGSFTLLTKVGGGKEVAFKIAEALHKAWHRQETIDGTCRNVITRLLAVKTLADWKPEQDWWSNQPGEEPAVIMVEPKIRSKETIPWHLAPPKIEMDIVEPAIVRKKRRIISVGFDFVETEKGLTE